MPRRTDPAIARFYGALLDVLAWPVLHEGEFTVLDPEAAWNGNPSHNGFVLFRWRHDDEYLLVVANHAPGQGQCRVWLDLPPDGVVRLEDLVGPERYERDGASVAAAGLYVDLPAWGLNVFAVRHAPG